MTIHISSNFDAGAIEVIRAERADDIELHIPKDAAADFSQWFYFRLQGARGAPCTIRFANAGQSTYPRGWEDYRVVASYDRQNWFRVPTAFDGSQMTLSHTPEYDSVYYAYFEPYSWERHLALIARVAQSPLARSEHLTATVEGRDLDLLQIGNPDAARKVWVIARQHPGETMAECFVEGLLDALLDSADPLAQTLLQHAVFYIVPNMNPDGSVRGNLRTNAAGVIHSRLRLAPSLATSPEVFAVRQKIHATGCDLFLDVHGDEALPYVFAAGSEMLDGFDAQQAERQQRFIDHYKLASPDFQDRVGYAAGKYNEDLLKLASKYIGHTFKCVSLTLELPFKDNADRPDAQVGWNGARSARLGRAALLPIRQIVAPEAQPAP
jgi:murein tripeptide amidase MpaA